MSSPHLHGIMNNTATTTSKMTSDFRNLKPNCLHTISQAKMTLLHPWYGLWVEAKLFSCWVHMAIYMIYDIGGTFSWTQGQRSVALHVPIINTPRLCWRADYWVAPLSLWFMIEISTCLKWKQKHRINNVIRRRGSAWIMRILHIFLHKTDKACNFWWIHSVCSSKEGLATAADLFLKCKICFCV